MDMRVAIVSCAFASLACAGKTSTTASHEAIGEIAKGDLRCPGSVIVVEHPTDGIFVVAGCSRIHELKVDCKSGDCNATTISSTRLPAPKRLRRKEGTETWNDPDARPDQPGGLPLEPPDPESGISHGRLVVDVGRPPHKPSLPPEINVGGVEFWGRYKVCVTAAGRVSSVQVLKSALPGGLDGAWIEKIEDWQYRPYGVNGTPKPFCYDLRLAVRSSTR